MKKDSQNTKTGPNITFKNVLFLFDKNTAYTFFETAFSLHMTSFHFSSSLEGNHRVQMPSYERSSPFSFFLN